MNSNKKIAYGFMILATILLFALWYALDTRDNFVDKKSSFDTPSSETVVTISWDGIYTNSSYEIALYKVDSNNINIVNRNNGTLLYRGEIVNNIVRFNDNDINYEIYKVNENIVISSSNGGSYEGNYVMSSSYTKENFISDTYGKENHLLSIWNGIYKSGNNVLKIYQLDKEKFVVKIYKDDNLIYNQEVVFKNNVLLYESDNENLNINISFSGSFLKVKSAFDNGLYKKEGAYNLNEIIADE